MKFLKLLSQISMGRLAVAAILITIAYYMVSFDNGANIQQEINGVKAELTVENTKKLEISKTMKKEEEMRGNLLQLARNLQVLKSKIPNDFKDTELSAIVNRAGAEANLHIAVLSRNAASGVTTVTGSELIEEIVFTITAFGSYSQLIQFVESLSREEKIIKTRNLVLEKNTTNVDDPTIRFSGEIIGFKQAHMEPPTAAGAGVRK